MFYVSVEAFLRDLPNQVDVGSKLSAVFATYNSISNFDDGTVDTGKNNLHIFIQKGGLDVDVFALAMLSMAIAEDAAPLAHDISEGMRHNAAVAQGVIAGPALEVIKGANTPVLVVVYAGYSAFDQAFEFARGIRKEAPAAKIVVLTCDCDFLRKQRVLQEAVEHGEISSYIKGAWCGGRSEMGKLVDGLIDFWPTA